jgi:hypothetical protein
VYYGVWKLGLVVVLGPDRSELRRWFLTSSAVWLFLAIWELFSCSFAPHDTFFGTCALTGIQILVINTPVAFLALPAFDFFWRITLTKVIVFKPDRLALARPLTALSLFAILFALTKHELSGQYNSPGIWYYDRLNHHLWAYVWPWVFAWFSYSIAMDREQ